ncbi:hypothetical protein HPB49_011490 [Dermacentor silvarum]|uniref:Uncharacterized protein n=1 Tax=Dermacentor silvarum TaxID=543639 RepID=A0ACB8C3D2_DERSI|nr:hypothetical protein HPB49_011490 [Dermacentor silvarum]
MEESPEDKIVPPSQYSRKMEQATLSSTGNTSAISASAEHERLETSQAGEGSLTSSLGEQNEHGVGLENVDSTTNECVRQTSVTNPAPSDLGPAEKPTSTGRSKAALPTILITDCTQNQGHSNVKRKSSEFSGSDTKAGHFKCDNDSPEKAAVRGSCNPQKVPRKENQPGGKESGNALLQAPQAEHRRNTWPLAQQGHLRGKPKSAVATVRASRRQSARDESPLFDVGCDDKRSKDGSPGIRNRESTHNEGSGSGVKRRSSEFTTSDTGKDFLGVGADMPGTVSSQFLSPPKKPRRHSFSGRTEETERADYRTKSAARPAAEGNLSCPTEFLLLAKPTEDENSEKTITKQGTETSIGISSTQPVAETCSSTPGQGAHDSKATATTLDTAKLHDSTLAALLTAACSRVGTQFSGEQEARRTAPFLREKSKTSVISSCPELGGDESKPRETPFQRGISPCLTLPSVFVTAAADDEAQKSAGTGETAHTDSISPSASVVGEKPFCPLAGRDSLETAATPLAEANLSPDSQIVSLLLESPERVHAEDYTGALEYGRAAGISSKPSAPTSGAEVGGPEVAGAPVDDNSSVRISDPLHSRTRENLKAGEFAERQSGYDGSNLPAQSVAATSSSRKNVAGSSHISARTGQELVRSHPAPVSSLSGNTGDVISDNSTCLSAPQDTACMPPARTGAATAASGTEYQFSVTQVSPMLQNVQLPPVPASRSQHVPARCQSSDPRKSAARQESGYGERFSSAHSEAATSSSTPAVAKSSDTTVAAGHEFPRPCPTLVALLTGNTEKVNADDSTSTSGYRDTTQVTPVQPVAGQRLSTSTEQDAGTPQEASETLQPHQGAQAQHYERSQPIGMHQHADEHSSRASYHEDSAAGQPRNANYAQPYQLATMPFLRRARQIRLRSPPNMSFFNPHPTTSPIQRLQHPKGRKPSPITCRTLARRNTTLKTCNNSQLTSSLAFCIRKERSQHLLTKQPYALPQQGLSYLLKEPHRRLSLAHPTAPPILRRLQHPKAHKSSTVPCRTPAPQNRTMNARNHTLRINSLALCPHKEQALHLPTKQRDAPSQQGLSHMLKGHHRQLCRPHPTTPPILRPLQHRKVRKSSPITCRTQA